MVVELPTEATQMYGWPSEAVNPSVKICTGKPHLVAASSCHAAFAVALFETLSRMAIPPYTADSMEEYDRATCRNKKIKSF